MRTGGTHKSGPERALLSARAQVSQALDFLDDQERLKELLTGVDKAIRSAELQLGSTRLHGRSDIHSQLIEDDVELSHDTRHWLLRNFSTADPALAENLHQIEATFPAGYTLDDSLQMTTSASVKDTLSAPDVAPLMQRAGLFDFEALQFTGAAAGYHPPISALGLHLATDGPNGNLISIMHGRDRFASETDFRTSVTSFFMEIDAHYKPDALYHGRAHAVDVMSTTAWFLTSEFLRTRMNAMDRFLILVASAVHDVGHMGRNNMFYTKTMHELAIKYNDKHVLENMHVSTSFEIMRAKNECNWFAMLDDSSKAWAREALISMVLATDPSKHAAHQGELKAAIAEAKDSEADPTSASAGAEKQKKLETKKVFLENLLHAADISNPTKPQPMMMAWTRLLLQEFWAQGDEERSLGVPISPLCDRESGMKTVPKGQIGFVNFVIQPYFFVIAEALDETKEAITQLQSNKAFWESKSAEEATYDQLWPA